MTEHKLTSEDIQLLKKLGFQKVNWLVGWPDYQWKSIMQGHWEIISAYDWTTIEQQARIYGLM